MILQQNLANRSNLEEELSWMTVVVVGEADVYTLKHLLHHYGIEPVFPDVH